MDDGLWMEEFAYLYVSFLPEREVCSHVQEAFTVLYVNKGRGIKQLGTYTSSFFAGEVVLISPHVPHSYEFNPSDTDKEGKIRLVAAFLKPSFLENVAEIFPELRDRVDRLLSLQGAVVFNADMSRRIIALLNSIRDGDLRKIGSILDLLSLVSNLSQGSFIAYERKSEERRFMDRVKAFLEAHIMEGVKKEDLAQHLGMSSATFDLKMRRFSGMNFSRYLNEYRLKHATCLLERECLPVSEICYLSGFNSLSHFNHLFKAYTGHTPSEFRQEMAIR